MSIGDGQEAGLGANLLRGKRGGGVDIGDWLRELGLGQYEEAFRRNQIDWPLLPKLTAEDLRDLGVDSVGRRRKLLTAIADLSHRSLEPPRASAFPQNGTTAERRLLTVFVCDLVGSTALAEKRDPEDMRAIIGAFMRCCAETIERGGGFVANYMGDGLLAYFGYPEAHERDPELAVEAGLALAAAVPKLETPAGAPLHVRIGIATGVVVVGDLLGSGGFEDRAVVGAPANHAARLQVIAAPDTVVIADSTRRFLGALYRLENLGARNLKGIGTPVRAWAVNARNAVESPFEALQGTRLSAFVGRERESERLTRRWAAAKSGAGAAVVLSGEPGVGKSRLAAEFLRGVVEEPHVRLRCYCSPQHRDSALHPVIRQLEGLAGFAREDSAIARLDKLDGVLAEAAMAPEEAALLADLLSLPGDGRYPAADLPPPRHRERILEALIGLIERLSRARPVLMVLEDAQWADPTTRELLARVVGKIGALRALVLVICRPEFAPAWLEYPGVETIALERLSAREIGLLVDDVASGGPLPDGARDEIVVRSEGVPLFAEEITKAVLETAEAGGPARLDAGAPRSATVPESLQASLNARLDRLGPAREVAQIAAAIGRECPQALLLALAAPAVAHAGGALETLVRAGILLRRGPGPDLTYVFKHALLQDLAYGALVRERKRTLHARIAATLEARFPEVVEAQPETLAHHCAEAGMTEKAASLWGKAGRMCLRESALKEAETHFSRALDLIAGQPGAPGLRREEIASQIGFARTLLLLRGYASAEARAALQQTIALIERAEALGEPVEHPLALFTTLHGFWLASIVAASGSATRKLAAQCLALAEKGGAKGGIIAGRHAVGLSLLFSGDMVGSLAHFDRAIAMFDPEEDRQETRYGGEYWSSAFAGRAAALWTLGLPDAARADVAASLQSARAFGHAMTLANNLVFAAWIRFACGRYPDAGAHAAELRALAHDKDEAYYRAFALMMEGLIAIAEGGGADAIGRTAAALDAYRATGATLMTAQVLAWLALGLAREGHPDDALRRLDEADATMAATEERWCESDIRRIAGEAALASPDRDVAAAERHFEAALAIARGQGAKSWELRAATSLARLWLDQGRPGEARALLEPVHRGLVEGFDTKDFMEAAAVLAQLPDQPAVPRLTA